MHNNPLFWEHGTFLQPQHFQLADRLRDNAIEPLRSLLCPHFWGIRRLLVREDALAAGIFELVDMDLLLPGGERLTHPGTCVLSARSFREAWVNPELPLMVWLGLPLGSITGGNVCETDSPERAASSARFIANPMPEHIADMLGSGPMAEIKTLRYNTRLYFGDEIEDAGELFRVPLALLVREGDSFRLDRNFVPPCIDLHAMPVLHEMLKDVRDSVLSRARQLEEYKIIVGDANVVMLSGAQSIALFTILGVLSRYAPVLEHLMEAGSLHPWPVYGVLRQIVGELSIFSAELSPIGETGQGRRVLPPYAHEDIAACFIAAKTIIIRLVEALVVGPDYMLRMTADGPRLGTLIPHAALSAGFNYWMLARSATPAHELADTMRLRAKCSAPDDLNGLVTRALPGIRLTAIMNPPAGLPRRSDTTYYAIDTDDPLWRRITQQGEISLFFPDAPPDLAIYLAAIRV